MTAREIGLVLALYGGLVCNSYSWCKYDRVHGASADSSVLDRYYTIDALLAVSMGAVPLWSRRRKGKAECDGMSP